MELSGGGGAIAAAWLLAMALLVRKSIANSSVSIKSNHYYNMYWFEPLSGYIPILLLIILAGIEC